MLVPLQIVVNAPSPNTLEDKPYAPLFVVSKYLENDLKCDNGNKLKVK